MEIPFICEMTQFLSTVKQKHHHTLSQTKNQSARILHAGMHMSKYKITESASLWTIVSKKLSSEIGVEP